jgi:hypothetical protein
MWIILACASSEAQANCFLKRLLCGMLLATACCSSSSAQDAAPVFRSTSELVLVDVQVINKKTKTATATLQQQDFQVSEDGALQGIKFFGRDTLPLSIVFLFDLTDSVRSVLKELAGGAKVALAHLKPEDEVAVMVYAASARMVDDFTTDRARSVAAIEKAARDESEEAAFFNEAVYQAAMQLERSANPSSRRVVIWLTDNLPNVPTEWMRADHGASVPKGALHTEKEAIRALHETGVVVAPLLKSSLFWHVFSLTEAPWRGGYPPGDAHKYAEWTGGQAMNLSGGKRADERLAQLIDDLRSRYTIGYQPLDAKPPGTFCKLRVTLAPGGPLRAKDWNVLARTGYYRK